MATTAQQANVDRIRRTYEAYTSGDTEAVARQFTDDVVFHILGHNRLSRDYNGKDEVFGFMGTIMALSGGSFRIEVHDILANEEHATALVTESAQREGKRWQSRAVHVTHFDAHGRTREFWAFQEDQATTDDFWA